MAIFFAADIGSFADRVLEQRGGISDYFGENASTEKTPTENTLAESTAQPDHSQSFAASAHVVQSAEVADTATAHKAACAP